MSSNRVTRQEMRQAGAKVVAGAKVAKPRKAKPKPLEQGFIPFQGETFKKQRKKPSQVEYRLHVTCTKWLKIFYPDEWKDAWHYPAKPYNGRHGHFLKEMDVKEGIWDYCIDLPRNGKERLHIEFKVDSGLSDEQEAFQERHKDRFAFAVVKSVDEFEKVIEWYFGYVSPLKKSYWSK